MTEIKDISNMNETYKAGVIGVHLNDPFSLLMDKIIGMKSYEYNAVGFYMVNGNGKHDVILYNVYDERRVSNNKYTLEIIAQSNMVSNINIYSLIDSFDSSSSQIISSRDMIKPKMIAGGIINKFAEKFIIMMNQPNSIYDNYEQILFNYLGMNDKLEITTGYDKVNGLFDELLDRKTSRRDKSILHTSLLRHPVLIESCKMSGQNIFEQDLLKRSKSEMIRFNNIFIDLYHTDVILKNKILSAEITSDDMNAKSIIMKEKELINHIIGGIQYGTVSNKTINRMIDDVNRMKNKIGDEMLLPRSINPSKTVNVINEEIFCTYQLDDDDKLCMSNTSDTTNNINKEALNHIENSLRTIIDSYINDKPIIINLNDIVMAYNNIATNNHQIEIPSTITSSKAGTIILCDENLMIEYDKLNHRKYRIKNHTTINNEDVIAIPIHGGNISCLNDSQLMDILIYIDSMRDNKGKEDKKYAYIQNMIVNQLALRRKK